MQDDSTVEDLRQRISELEVAHAAQAAIKKELRQANALLASTLEATADGVLVVDREGRRLSHNQRFVDLWRIPDTLMADYRSQATLAFVQEQLKDPAGFLRRVNTIYSQSEAESFDILEFRDGRVFERYSRPQRVGEEIVGRVWSFRDVTARVKAEKARGDSEEKYRRLFDEAPLAYQMLDVEGRLWEVNRTWLLLLGREREEVIGRQFEDFIAPEYRNHFRKIFGCFLSAGEIHDEELAVLRCDGTRIPILFEGSVPNDSQDGVRLTRCILQDITERKQMVAELHRANADLERRVAQRTEQLRQLATEVLLAEQRERRRLAELLHDHLQQLLVSANLQVGAAATRTRSVALRTTLQGVERQLATAVETARSLTADISPPVLFDSGLAAALRWLGTWMREQHGLNVSVMASAGADPQDEGSRILLFQSVRELLFNVKKHAGIDKAQVTLKRVDDARIQIRVEDKGRGFPQLVAQESAGSFGLVSIRERISQMGGTMRIESASGKGTRVTLIAAG